MKQFILMSDIIDSSNKNQIELINDFKKTVSFINLKYKEHLSSPLTITLGDEFQGIVKNIDSSINIMIDIEEFIIKNKFGFKLRYILNQGKVDTSINSKIAYEMLGKGLTESRKKLEQLKRSSNRFDFFLDDSNKALVINKACQIIDNIISKWDIDRDYEIVSAFIKYRDYKKVAETLKKNRSLMWKREKNLNMASYFSIKEILYTVVKL